jgi:hypothetical protein
MPQIERQPVINGGITTWKIGQHDDRAREKTITDCHERGRHMDVGDMDAWATWMRATWMHG